MDIKKVQDASEDAFRAAAKARRYDFQAAWYLTVCRNLCDVTAERFKFVAVEESPPHGVGLYTLDKELIDKALPDVTRAIDLYAQCIETNQWPGYGTETRLITWRTFV